MSTVTSSEWLLQLLDLEGVSAEILLYLRIHDYYQMSGCSKELRQRLLNDRLKGYMEDREILVVLNVEPELRSKMMDAWWRRDMKIICKMKHRHPATQEHYGSKSFAREYDSIKSIFTELYPALPMEKDDDDDDEDRDEQKHFQAVYQLGALLQYPGLAETMDSLHELWWLMRQHGPKNFHESADYKPELHAAEKHLGPCAKCNSQSISPFTCNQKSYCAYCLNHRFYWKLQFGREHDAGFGRCSNRWKVKHKQTGDEFTVLLHVQHGFYSERRFYFVGRETHC